MTSSLGHVGVGIDFGTTNSLVATMSSLDRPVRAELDGGLPHPSIVWYGPQETIVGRLAKDNFNAYAEHIGHRFVRSIKKNLGPDRSFDILGVRRSAAEVASEIFRHLKSHAERNGDIDISEAVVTVPVGFDGNQRSEIRRAAAMAGIHITTFVHEPFAAVIGYYRTAGFDPAALPDETLLVFDWGGGTLDITLTRVRDGRLYEAGTGSLSEVAGDRFDRHIQAFARDRFLARSGLRGEVFSPAPRTKDRLAVESERAKISLSTVADETVQIPRVLEVDGRPYDLSEELTRGDFERLISQDMADAFHVVDVVLDEARVLPEEVDKVLLIGGTSLIPALQDEMKRRFGARAINVAHAQSIIAEGAAIIAYLGLQPSLARPIGVRLADGTFHTMFDRDTLVPVTSSKNVTLFVTDNRDGEARILVEDQARTYDALSTATKDLLIVPVSATLPRPYNHERVYLEMSIDENLILRTQGYGAAKAEVVQSQVHDLKFGLRTR